MKKITSLPTKDIDRNTQMYDEYINKYRMDNGWDPGNQQYNFKSLLRILDLAGVPLKNASVLDVGCGTGDFFPILSQKGIKRYVGIDIYEPSINQARLKFPHELFIMGDLLQDAITETFDYAFCSGALTVKLSIDNYDFLRSMITKMWEMTNVGVAFNVLIEDDDPDPDLFFYNPAKVIQICQEIDRNAVIGAEKTPRVSQIHVYMYRDFKG